MYLCFFIYFCLCHHFANDLRVYLFLCFFFHDDLKTLCSFIPTPTNDHAQCTHFFFFFVKEIEIYHVCLLAWRYKNEMTNRKWFFFLLFICREKRHAEKEKRDDARVVEKDNDLKWKRQNTLYLYIYKMRKDKDRNEELYTQRDENKQLEIYIFHKSIIIV